MIHSCLDLIRTELNDYLRAQTSTQENPIVLANLRDQVEAQASNQVVMSLVDIAQQAWGGTDRDYIPQSNGGYITRKKPINLNIHLLFSVHFTTERALEGIQHLSLVIAFFQAKNYFDTTNTPTLHTLQLDNLMVELVDLEPHEKSALWSCLGAHYLPSVLYKLSTIPVEDTEAIGEEIPEVKKVIIQ
ncbi:MAG: DUF4255 domain-containing protein [Bacteroidota bacterium]